MEHPSFYQKLSRTPQKFFRFTGLPLEAFQKLAGELEPLWQEAEEKRLSRPDRKRAIGGGGKYKLTEFHDKLLVLLMYLRLYLTLEVLEYFFGAHYSTLNRLINRLEPVAAKRLKPMLPTTRPQKRIGSWEEFARVYPDLVEIVIDATEHRIQRPSGWKRQKPYYSGKTKKHALKTQVVVSQTGRVLSVSPSVPASMHDYTLLTESGVMDRLPPHTVTRVDLGYLGITDDFPERMTLVPERKPRNQGLTATVKRQNRRLAKGRIVVEHAIAKLKKFQILYQTYRNRRRTYNRKFQIVAGLVNLRMGFAT